MYKKTEYALIGFRKSTQAKKKYDAIIRNKMTGEEKVIAFGSGDPLMGQYKDSTGLGIYSYLDHNDEKRRQSFRKRFRSLYDPSYYTPISLSMEYLW